MTKLTFGVLYLILSLFGEYGTTTAQQELSSPIVTNFGEWHPWESCPDGMFVVGMKLKTQIHRGTWKDDTALNGLKFYCDAVGKKGTTHKLISGQGERGCYDQTYFCDGLATGFQMRSEKFQSFAKDDTAANNLRLVCNGNTSNVLQGDGLSFGDWTAPQHCPQKKALCAYSSQVEEDDGSLDDYTALNNIRMRCCDVPDPAAECEPGDKWDLVISCDNTESTSPTPFRCEHKEKVGVSHTASSSESHQELVDSYVELGFSLPTALSKLGFNFGSKLKHSRITNHTWEASSSETWSVETTTTVSFEVPAGMKAQLFQVQGLCGIYSARPKNYKKVETDAKSNKQTITYF